MSTAKRTIFIAPKCVAHRRIASKSTARRRILIEGTGDMIAKRANWGVPAPEWYEDDVDDFRVALKRPIPATEEGRTGLKSRVKSSVKKLSSAEKIVAYLCTTLTASAHELSIVVNLTVRAVEKNLRVLREYNRLRRVGPDKGGHWEVIG